MSANAFVVESPVHDHVGIRVGTARHWVATRERAVAEAAKVASRTWREVPAAEVPEGVRLNFANASTAGT